MLTERAAGVLLHPTSMPTRFGIGDLGPVAYQFVDWLAEAGQTFWQILPLNPTDVGESPYQSPSVFAGNPLLISLDRLHELGLLTAEELNAAAIPDGETRSRVPFDEVTPRKSAALEQAISRFQQWPEDHPLHVEYSAYCQSAGAWLDNHAMFLALREANDGRVWTEWTNHVTETKVPLAEARHTLAGRLAAHRFLQFLFARQWRDLKAHAASRGLRIFGDLPIYVSHNSADVWAHRSLFQLDPAGRSTRVAGVPPDYFSETGQLWNNPLYDWDVMARDGFRWWVERLEVCLESVDLVRLDHFRGFEAYWSVPAGEATAVNGEWIPGPADAFLQTLAEAFCPRDDQGHIILERLPIIAEDLGLITEPVHALRKNFLLPGMQVLHFVLPGEPHEEPDPREFDENTIVYTGTHDNDTTVGWFSTDILPYPDRLERLRRLTPCHTENIAWELIELAWAASSRVAITPLQDILSLPGDARMNAPGTFGAQTGNWCWKYQPGCLTPELAGRLREVTERHGRARA